LAKAQQTEAERVYEILKDGPDPKEVALAEAKLKNAQSQLTAAQAAVGNLELRAPFTGTVVTVDLKSGEYVNPGVSVVMIADFSDWRVETTDLTELNVVRINENDPVKITFDALPGVEFPGRVSLIRTLGESRQGDITYTVLIDLEKYDPRLRWNMTCSAVIGTSQ
jgi:multidrug resistance efflux pump